jgi:carbonic anhydrase
MGELKVKGIVPNVEVGYVLENIHFHNVAEHAVDGKKYTIEMHIVHGLKKEFDKYDIKKKLVIGVLFNFNATGKYCIERRNKA